MIIGNVRSVFIVLVMSLFYSCKSDKSITLDTCVMTLFLNQPAILTGSHLYDKRNDERLLIQFELDDSGLKSYKLDELEYTTGVGEPLFLNREKNYNLVIQILDSNKIVVDSYYYSLNSSLGNCSKHNIKPMK